MNPTITDPLLTMVNPSAMTAPLVSPCFKAYTWMAPHYDANARGHGAAMRDSGGEWLDITIQWLAPVDSRSGLALVGTTPI